MGAVAALLALAEANADARAASLAAAQLYEKACVEGQFKLDRKQGSLVKPEEIPYYVRGPSYSFRKVEQGLYVKMLDPPRTYLQIITYSNPKPGSEASECTLSSLALNFDDAVDMFNKNAEALAVYENNVGDIKSWVIDVPQRGYKKYLAKWPRGWVILQTIMYQKPN